MKEKVNPNHHMGKQTGYDLVDGAYRIAPLYQNQLDFIIHQKEGIEQMVAMVTKHAAQDLTELSKKEQAIWNELSDDIGLPKDKKWAYSNGTIVEVKS